MNTIVFLGQWTFLLSKAALPRSTSSFVFAFCPCLRYCKQRLARLFELCHQSLLISSGMACMFLPTHHVCTGSMTIVKKDIYSNWTTADIPSLAWPQIDLTQTNSKDYQTHHPPFDIHKFKNSHLFTVSSYSLKTHLFAFLLLFLKCLKMLQEATKALVKIGGYWINWCHGSMLTFQLRDMLYMFVPFSVDGKWQNGFNCIWKIMKLSYSLKTKY